MDRHMASSLDHWLTTIPEPQDLPMPGEPNYPACGRCGAFLRRNPDEGRTTVVEYQHSCLGYGPEADPLAQLQGWEPDCGLGTTDHAPHVYTYHVSEIAHRLCKKCGHDNEEVLG